MIDNLNRNIDYMRLSITDRCNLRCKYCKPQGVALCSHDDILSYEELLRVCTQAVELGIVKFKVTGGEPLARRNCVEFIRSLKALNGVKQVTLTTSGLLLNPILGDLARIGLDGINISIDTLDPAQYAALTGFDNGSAAIKTLLKTLDDCLSMGLRTKVNVVLLDEARLSWTALATLAKKGLDVRFIELMPIGMGPTCRGVDSNRVLEELRCYWPDLHPVDEKRGNGPARYFASAELQGRIGLIDAVSHKFCQNCNRVRLTSTGLLKPCLCYGTTVDLRALLRGGANDGELRVAMEQGIFAKPAAHCFERPENISETKNMSQIGG